MKSEKSRIDWNDTSQCPIEALMFFFYFCRKHLLGTLSRGSLLVQVSCSRFDKTADLPCFSCGCPLIDVEKFLLHNQQTTHLASLFLREGQQVKPMVGVPPFFFSKIGVF